MKRSIIAASLLLGTSSLFAWEFPQNPDRFPSVGFTATNTSLSGHRDEVDTPSPILTRTQGGTTDSDTHSIGADLRLPLHNSVTLTFAYDAIDTDYHFQRGGNIYHETERLSGYRYSVGFRLYLNK